jgi:serine/threonine-protein kinase
MTSWLKLGCAGVQALPEPGDCPKESIAGMKSLGWAPSQEGPLFITIDVNQPQPPGNEITPAFNGVFKDGPVTGELARARARAPLGTKLTGHLWTHGDRLYGRYLWAHVPGKGKIPICVELGDWGQVGIDKRDGSKPGAIIARKQAPAFFTREWR